jgi:hypothetical protein
MTPIIVRQTPVCRSGRSPPPPFLVSLIVCSLRLVLIQQQQMTSVENGGSKQ